MTRGARLCRTWPSVARPSFDGYAATAGALRSAACSIMLAAFVVKSLPLVWLRWLVVIVVLYAASSTAGMPPSTSPSAARRS